MKATIVITTRNRVVDLRLALASCLAQEYPFCEILVFDDASTDGTAEMVQREFPKVRLVRSNMHLGLVALRSRGFYEATGDIVFSLDDDAYFTCSSTVARTIKIFSRSPRIVAVALPYIEPSNTNESRSMETIQANMQLRGFVGCAHALRRDIVVQNGCYRDFFIHQGEERDLAIRLLDAGYEIVLGNSPPIVHSRSPKRDLGRMSYYGVRNTLLFDLLNVPQPHLVPRLLADTFNLLRYDLTWRSAPTRVRYVLGGMLSCLMYWQLRKPVCRETYRRYRELPSHGPLPLKLALNYSVVGTKLQQQATTP